MFFYISILLCACLPVGRVQADVGNFKPGQYRVIHYLFVLARWKMTAALSLIMLSTQRQHRTVLFIFLFSLLLFCLLSYQAAYQKELKFDSIIIRGMNGWVSPTMTSIMKVFTFMGSRFFIVPGYVLLTGWLLFYQKNKQLALLIPLTGISGNLAVYLIKYLLHRARRLDPIIASPSDYSFPSGHAASSFIFYGLLICFIWRSASDRLSKIFLTIFLLIVLLMVGASRIYLGVHYPSDVTGGFCFGLMWLILSLWVWQLPRERSDKIINGYFNTSKNKGF